MSFPPRDEKAARQWRHDLRNELNVVTMATSTAIALLGHGASLDLVRDHLARAEAACGRCRDLVMEPDDPA